MRISEDEVAAVIITYGNRYLFVRQVIHSLLAQKIGQIIVVDNASSDESLLKLLNLVNQHVDKITLIKNNSNLGSSGGISEGLKFVQNTLQAKYKYIWLLDDDNVPRLDALQSLIKQGDNFSAMSVLHSLRGDASRNYIRSLTKYFPPRSSFYEFDVLTFFLKILNFFYDRIIVSNKPKISFCVPYAPYGGLYFHRLWLNKIGFPDERFFVYCDDTEYTYRITQNGGTISYILGSIIDDVDMYWGRDIPFISKFTHIINSKQWPRVYYTIRNHSYFDSNIWIKSRLKYQANKFFYLTIVRMYSNLTHDKKRYKAVVKAIIEGENRQLGKLEGNNL